MFTEIPGVVRHLAWPGARSGSGWNLSHRVASREDGKTGKVWDLGFQKLILSASLGSNP